MALADNKAKIQALLNGINALPEAGSGEAPAPVLQEKAVTPTKTTQSVTPDSGYDGLSKVNVGAIPDEYIVPSGTVQITENGTHNVREAENVNVTVPAPEITLQTKTVTPSETAQTVKPDSGYDGLSKVNVGAISKTYVGSSVPKQAAQTITPGAADKTIASGSYLTGVQTIKGDANLVAGNIKSGVSIFGVDGTMTAGEDVTAETNTYTDLLDDLEEAVYALPDAGSGDGASVETCTVTVVNCKYVYYTGVSNGNLVGGVSASASIYSTHTVTALRGSTICAVQPITNVATLTNAAYVNNGTNASTSVGFTVTGESARIQFNTSGGND